MERRRSNTVAARPHSIDLAERGGFVRSFASTASLQLEGGMQRAGAYLRLSQRCKLGLVFGVGVLCFAVILLCAKRGGRLDVQLPQNMRRARTLELEQAEQQAALGKQTQQPSTLELLAAVSAASAAPTAALDLEGSIPRILPAPTNAALNTSSSDTDSLPAAENETSASGQEALTGADSSSTPLEKSSQLGQEEPAHLSSDLSFKEQTTVKATPSVLDILEQNRTKCPLQYDRISYEDIKSSKYQPYLLGEQAKPACNNCKKDELWAHFCQFQTHGPVCPGWLKWQIASDWVKRAEQDSPGMKEMLGLTPCDLFPFIRDRTLWLIGDSLTLEWDKAVQCFLFEFWDLQLRDLPEIHPDPPYEFQGWCAHMAQGAKVCFVRGNTGDQFADGVLPNLAALGATPTDIMVLNFAVWQNTRDDYVQNITRFAQYFEAHKSELPIAIWRDAPVQHFDTGSGDYIWPVPSQDCKPINSVELQPDNSLLALHDYSQVLAEGGWRNKIALPVLEGIGVPIVRTWNQSLPMWQYHTNYSEKDGDCTHMCHPSEYQYWVYELYRTLRTRFPELALSY